MSNLDLDAIASTARAAATVLREAGLPKLSQVPGEYIPALIARVRELEAQVQMAYQRGMEAERIHHAARCDIDAEIASAIKDAISED